MTELSKELQRARRIMEGAKDFGDRSISVPLDKMELFISTIESLSEQNKEQSKELERLKGVCKMLIGEEVMFQEGKYETEMSKLRDENISLCNQLREAVEALEFYAEDKTYLWDKENFRPINNDCGYKADSALSRIQGKEKPDGNDQI